MSPENPLNPDQLLIQTPIEAAYLFVCLLLCLSTSLSFSPSFCPSFDPSVHMPASFLAWVARHTIIINWGHNLYNCSTTSSLDINVSGSEVKTSSIITSITTSSWYNSSTRERKEAKKFEKGKISLYPTANIRKHKITKMCSVLSINQKEYLQQKNLNKHITKNGNQSINHWRFPYKTQ